MPLRDGHVAACPYENAMISDDNIFRSLAVFVFCTPSAVICNLNMARQPCRARQYCSIPLVCWVFGNDCSQAAQILEDATAAAVVPT